MTDNVSSESDEEQTEWPPPAKKLKQKMLQFSRSTDTATITTSADSQMREELTTSSLASSSAVKG